VRKGIMLTGNNCTDSDKLQNLIEEVKNVMDLLRSGTYPGGATDWTIHLAFKAESLKYELADLLDTWEAIDDTAKE
jgi:hypothetical protein